MLTIIVVDDEHLTHLGLKMAIDWEKYGFQIIGDAKTGEEGLELALKLRPDIIITDVCMPNMDGLEMISQLREHNLDPKIIVISAFDEFHYVKRALESKAIAYLLKPIKDAELINVLLEQKKIIEREKKMKSEIEDYHENLDILKEHFFIDLFNGKSIDEETLDKKVKAFDIPENKNFYIIKLGLDAYKELTKNNEADKLFTLNKQLKEEINQAFSNTADFHINLITDEKYCTVVLFTTQNIQFVTEQCRILNKAFGRNTQNTISIGISNSRYSLLEAQDAYVEATDALKFKSVMGHNSVIQAAEITSDRQQSNLTQSEINSIITCIKAHKSEETFMHLNELFRNLKNNNSSIDYVKELCVQLSVLAYNTSSDGSDTQQNEQLMYISSEIHEQETIQDVFEWTKNFIDDILKNLIQSEELAYRKDVRLAINYIKNNFDKQITAEQVANELFISYHYLMHIFTRDVGKTFNEYLTDYRIEVAKDMLKNQNITVSKVSEMIGYKSPKYFGILFKKKTGLTPKEYAEQKYNRAQE